MHLVCLSIVPWEGFWPVLDSVAWCQGNAPWSYCTSGCHWHGDTHRIPSVRSPSRGLCHLWGHWAKSGQSPPINHACEKEANLIFFQLIKVSTQNQQKTTSMHIPHCCKSFLFFFSLNPWQTDKYIRFICYHIIFVAFKESKYSF